MKFFAYKQNGKLIPSSQSDKEKVDKLPSGEPFRLIYEQSRNPKLLAKYWVLMDFAFKNLPEKYDGYWAVVDDFEEEVLKAIGWKIITKDFKGNDVVKAKSISYKNCSEDKFQEIYSRSLTLICRMIGVEETDIMDELLNFM